jgi:hypothetical protein
MTQRLGMCVFLSTALLFAASCTKYGEPGPGEQKFAVERLPQPNVVPASWGKLVATSSNASAENWIQLWFQDDGGNIRMVGYNARDRFLSLDGVLIRRN